MREGAGGVPLVCVHGWPESKRIFWRVIEPLAAAGFDVIVPDLRGFGDSDLGPDGFHDVASHVRDLYALVHDVLGHERVVLVGGDLGGPVVQDLALRHPDWVDRMVLFNSPLPFDKERMAGMRTRPPREASDYFVRQGDRPRRAGRRAGHAGRAAPLHRHLLHVDGSGPTRVRSSTLSRRPPGRFGGSAIVDFHTEPFADGAKLRACFGGYESAFDAAARLEPTLLARNERTPTLLLFGPSDHVIYPDFDRMAAVVFAHHVGSIPAAGLRPLRALGGAPAAGHGHGRAVLRPVDGRVARAQFRGVALGHDRAHTQGVSIRPHRGGAHGVSHGYRQRGEPTGLSSRRCVAAQVARPDTMGDDTDAVEDLTPGAPKSDRLRADMRAIGLRAASPWRR